jgi:hypothetical protein
MSILDEHFKQEEERTKECLADLIKFLSHDTSLTRRQLAKTLRERAELIDSEARANSVGILTGGIDLTRDLKR